MKTTISLFGFVVALSCGAYDFYNIMPYSPGREKALAADCVAYAKKTGNTKILYSLTLHPEGRPARTKAEAAFASYRALREALKGTDVELVTVVNTCFEGMKSLPIRMPADARRVEQLLPDGSWKELAFVRGADGYADLPIALPCYGMAIVRIGE